MTVKAIKCHKEKSPQGGTISTAIHFAIVAAMIGMCICFSSEISKAIHDGIILCAFSIIPSLFPFFVISDFLMSCSSSDGIVGRCFQKIFGISSVGCTAFICGTLCGFPIGVSAATDLYRKGSLTSDECERLAGISTNPSLAFVISGVGASINGHVKYGILLYLSVIFSALAVGIIFAKKHTKNKNTRIITGQNFDIVASIKKAGTSSINVSCYIIFFCAVLGVIHNLIKSNLLFTLAAAILEIGNAVSVIKKASDLSPLFTQIMTGFALGFSGISVHLQAFSYFPKELSKKKFLLMKAMQGGICAAFVALFCTVIQ